MNTQDRKKSLTAEELRRRYNLDDLNKDRKAIQLQKNQINNIGTQLDNFVDATTQSLQELQNQVDGNITTWFYNGVPTTSNEPAVNWTTDDEKINHLGDLYYDQNTGYAYRWAYVNNAYEWSRIVDADVVEALAVANAAKDTADSKRRVFVSQPQPPYDIGDIWIKDDEDLYRCITATPPTGTYNIAHWVLATKYTDDTVANQSLQELNQFKVNVAEDYATNASLQTTADSINGRVDEVYTYTTTVEDAVGNVDAKVDEVKNTVETNQSATEVSINLINEQLTNGVTKFYASTGYLFDLDGLHISKTNSTFTILIDNEKLVVADDDVEKFKADADGVVADNMTVNTFIIHRPIREQKAKAVSDTSKNGLCFFWIGE